MKSSISIEYDEKTGIAVLVNGRLEITVKTQPWLNPCSFKDTGSGRKYADSDYVWTGAEKPVLIGKPVIKSKDDGTRSIIFMAESDKVVIEHSFILPAKDPDACVENLALSNPGGEYTDLPAFACGFAKKIRDGGQWLSDIADERFCEIPYRYHPETGELCDRTVRETAENESWFSTARSAIYNRKTSTARGSEAWAWYSGGNALMISKYNPDSMEWSLIEPVDTGTDGAGSRAASAVMRFGGAGRWKHGDPEGAARICPGGRFVFGETRYKMLDGDYRQAYADFRRYNDGRGHVVPEGFDPPVHWNELYDNPYWWKLSDGSEGGDSRQLRNKYYRLPDMEAEAEKAFELGCGCLYLDPGWDTSFGSNIWDEERLGKQKDFVKWLKDKYGMELALHTPLAPWSDGDTYPAGSIRKGEDGKNLGEICVASREYMDVKVERLKTLCKNGAYFLMYDGSWYDSPCWDPSHSHSVPSTRQEHVDAILSLAQRLHEDYPGVLIEQHDPITGPGTPRYAPTYFMHGKPGAFDELWGYEYMVESMDDILSHRAFSLYYYNLAYNIPVYLHIDLRKDNSNALVFWWYASTCRHLGIGGKHADPEVWDAHKAAMKRYLENKRFFAQGVFYGIDELTHIHALPDAGECVVNCFNLDDSPACRKLQFRPEDAGLAADAKCEDCIGNAESLCIIDGKISMDVFIPAKGHTLVKIRNIS